MILRYSLSWIILMLAAIANGAVREFVYRPAVGELLAHQISTLTAIILFGAIVWLLERIWPLNSGQAVQVGIIWLFMTVVFEFGFGHFVAGHPWEKLLHDYNLAAGRVWIFVLLWVVLVPYVVHRLQKSRG
jgi:hypothetical protein